MAKRFALLLLFCLPLLAWGEDVPWTQRGEDGQPMVHVYLFWSQQCPHCLEARPKIRELAANHPWIGLHDYELSRNPDNVRRFAELARRVGAKARAVPTLIYCGRIDVGWDSSAQPAERLLTRLEACRQDGGPAPAAVSPPLSLPLFGEIDASALSLPLLTIVIAALDAFNPCAFFVLLFLLSLLVHQQSRRRMLLIGVVFVAVSGLLYFAFMAAWLNVFLMFGGVPWLTVAAGGLALMIGAINVKDFVRLHSGVSLSLSETGKARVFQRARRVLAAGSLPAMLMASVVLAVAANLYELLCTAGLPMLYTRLLTLQVPGGAMHYLYLALYNTVYVLPLLLIVAMFARTMGARRLSEREGRLLKLLSGLLMLGLGVLLLLAPQALASIGPAFAVPAIALAITWVAARLTRGQ